MKVAINGFGRIGRLSFRNLLNSKEVEVVAINDLTDTLTLAHLLKYDSTQGKFLGTVSHGADHLMVNGKRIAVSAIKDPASLPWKALGVDVVLECTGVFTSAEGAGKHLTAGARKVVISAPANDGVKTIVLGVNDEDLKAEDTIISNASCTTNCLAPMAKVLHDSFGIKTGYMTTIHAYTADQSLQDSPHKDLRRARAAALSMVPTTTGAARAVTLVLPALIGKLDGAAVRVPVPTGSLTDFHVILEKDASVEEVNAAMKKASEGSMKGILEYCTDLIVSADIVGSPYSCIFDSDLTSKQGELMRVVGWYDNEAGYSKRAAELVALISKL